MIHENQPFRPSKRDKPCPICSGIGCGQSESGAVACFRVTDPPPGWREAGRSKLGQVVFAPVREQTRRTYPPKNHNNGHQPPPMPTDPPAATPAPRQPAAAPTLPRMTLAELDRMAVESQKRLTPEELYEWAKRLGIPEDSLRACRVGAIPADTVPYPAGEAKQDGNCLVWPELSGKQHITGFACRYPQPLSDGRTKGWANHSGQSARGLTIPAGLKLDGTGTVLVVEGMSDVAACHALGLQAVGRPSNLAGSKELGELLYGVDPARILVVGENDFKPAKKHLPDVQSWPGRYGAYTIADQLGRELKANIAWTMPQTGIKDIRDWVSKLGLDITDPPEAWRAQGEAILAKLVANAQTGSPWPEIKAVQTVRQALDEDFRPFPTHCLPYPVSDFVSSLSASLGVNESYVALPVLSCLAASIGTTRRIEIKPDWHEPAILWTCIVGDSGTLKSPALTKSCRLLRDYQQARFNEYKAACKEHQDALEDYKVAAAEWKKAGRPPGGLCPERPEDPVCERVVVDDCTIESLAPILSENPRGLMLAKDELATWFSSFDAYKARSGGLDAARWLELHSGRSLTIDRKDRMTGKPVTTHIPIAAVSVAGGIQPEILAHHLTPNFFSMGLPARLLLAMPPKVQRTWHDGTVDLSLWRMMQDLYRGLLAMKHNPSAQDGPKSLTPVDVPMDPAASLRFRAFVNENAAEQFQMDDTRLVSAWSKLEGYAARIALIHHLVRVIAKDPSLVDPEAVSVDSVAKSIELTKWFAFEARRVYRMLSANVEEPLRIEAEKALNWVKRQVVQGVTTFTTREFFQTLRTRRMGRMEDWEPIIEKLQDKGYIRRVVIKAPNRIGGRTSEGFECNPAIKDKLLWCLSKPVYVTQNLDGKGK